MRTEVIREKEALVVRLLTERATIDVNADVGETRTEVVRKKEASVARLLIERATIDVNADVSETRTEVVRKKEVLAARRGPALTRKVRGDEASDD